jgi:hypothetical protein
MNKLQLQGQIEYGFALAVPSGLGQSTQIELLRQRSFNLVDALPRWALG